MVFRLWSTMRGMLVVLCFVFAVVMVPQSVHADCEIKSVNFFNKAPYNLPDSQNDPKPTPFFASWGENSVALVKITTNDDIDCAQKKVYITIFSNTGISPADQQNGIPDKVVGGIANQEYELLEESSQLAAGPKKYGISASFNMGEEACYPYSLDDIKKLVQAEKDTRPEVQSYLDGLLSNDNTKSLYGFLLDKPEYGTVNPNDATKVSYSITEEGIWTAKKMLYKLFNRLECGYYARASLQKVDQVSLASGNNPWAQFQPAVDQSVNFVGYMCNITDYKSAIQGFKEQPIRTILEATTLIGATGGLGSIVVFYNGATALLGDHLASARQAYQANYCDSRAWAPRNASAGFNDAGIDLNDKCMINNDRDPGCYELLAPIPGLGETINFQGTAEKPPFALGEFFTAGINVVIGAVSILAVLALMMYGFMMMRDRSAGNPVRIRADREKIFNVLFGIAIILGSYVILNTINPALLLLSPELESVALESKGSLSDADYTKYTGAVRLDKTAYDKAGDEAAAKAGIDRCFMRVILNRESRGNPGAIGCDENVKSNDVPSRRAFVQSLLKYDGTPIPYGTTVLSAVYNGSQKCKPDLNQEGLGVDWRFSKGIGLMQLTVFPKGYFDDNKQPYFSSVQGPNGALWAKRKIPLRYEPNGPGTQPSYSPAELLVPARNLEAGANLFKKYLQKCNNSALGAFTAYATGRCKSTSGKYAYEEPLLRTQMYNACKAGKLPE